MVENQKERETVGKSKRKNTNDNRIKKGNEMRWRKKPSDRG